MPINKLSYGYAIPLVLLAIIYFLDKLSDLSTGFVCWLQEFSVQLIIFIKHHHSNQSMLISTGKIWDTMY